MNKNKNKKTVMLTIIGMSFLLVTVVGATYAYFRAQMGTGTDTNINAQAGTTYSLTFTEGSDITINVNQSNFEKGFGNRTGESTTIVKLIANDNTYTAKYTYNVYLNITTNQLKYTTADRKPELILEITGPDGKIETLDGYAYKTVETNVTNNEKQIVSGFDITQTQGIIPIKFNQVIEVNGKEDNPKIQEWTFKVTFINLDSDQKENSGKLFSAQAVVQQDSLRKTLADVCPLGTENFAECIQKLNNQYSDFEETNLFYHDGSHKSYVITGDTELKVTSIHSNDYKSIEDIITYTCPPGTIFHEGYTGYGYCVNSVDGIEQFVDIYSLTYENSDKKYDYLGAVNKAIEDGYIEGANY